METDALKTLKESLALNVALKERFERLGDFAQRVERLRTAKLMNEGQIIALKEQLDRLQGRLIGARSVPTAKLMNEGQMISLKEQLGRLQGRLIEPKMKQQIIIRPVQRPVNRRVQEIAQRNKVPSNWNHLAALLERASGKVSVVGKKRDEVLAHLEAQFGKERAMALSSRFQVLQKVPKTSKGGVIVFPKAGQDPLSIQRMLQKRKFERPSAVIHNGRALHV